MTETTKQTYNRAVAWKALFAVLVAYLVGTALKFQVPPIALTLNEELGMSVAQNGWLMSVMAIGFLVMAIPSAPLINKIGSRNATVLACVICLAGTVAGAFAVDFYSMLVTRAIEGIGMGIVLVVSLSVVAEFFPPEKRGLPNSCIAGCYVLSYFLMMNIAAPIADAFSWRGVWWFGAIIAVISVLVALALIPKKGHELGYVEEKVEESEESWKLDYKVLLTNPATYILPIVFVLFNIGYQGIITYMPTYLVEIVGAEVATANFATSLNALVGLPASLIAGLILNKLAPANRKWLPTATMFVIAVCYFFAFSMPTIASATFLLVAVGFVTCFVPPSLFTMGPDSLPGAAYAAAILAIVTFGQNLGMVLGPIVVGYIVEFAGNWAAVSLPTAVMAAIGGIILIFTKAADTKKDAADKE